MIDFVSDFFRSFILQLVSFKLIFLWLTLMIIIYILNLEFHYEVVFLSWFKASFCWISCQLLLLDSFQMFLRRFSLCQQTSNNSLSRFGACSEDFILIEFEIITFLYIISKLSLKELVARSLDSFFKECFHFYVHF